ncbi:MAG: sugar ABC transporter ATP-binding protein [Phycisphaerae bacterium]|nr:sugar ABC transporter ATP-binding protein [Phycisphaerae bacterium]
MSTDVRRNEPPPLLRMTGVVKSFDGQRVLHDVDFDLRRGEVHILAGENGAGKSTLIKILGGVHRPDRGEIMVKGRALRFRSPRDAAAHGVAIIHQELSLVPSLSVADNIFLGREQSTWGWMRFSRQHAECAAVLDRLGLQIDSRRLAGALPISLQQMIEIAKAMARQAEIVVMDEPTSALNEPEVQRLFECIAELKSQGRGVVYITHKLEEVYRIADRITVLRDGYRVAGAPVADMPANTLIRHMVGRELRQQGEVSTSPPLADAPVMLKLKDVTVRAAEGSRRPRVDRLSLSVRAGEIMGLAGLHGSGNSDLLMGLFGAYGRRTTGTVLLDGRPYRPTSPRRAIDRGLALVTNDRQRTGLVLSMSVAANATLAALPRVSPWGWMLAAREFRLADETTRSLRLRAASLRQSVATLSGGNQQKVVLAKWISTRPRVILLDEPTRGVDIGAKQEIYQLMHAWRGAGHALILITSEMSELLMMSDRILVMHRGRAKALLSRGEATQERILRAAMGGTDLGA